MSSTLYFFGILFFSILCIYYVNQYFFDTTQNLYYLKQAVILPEYNRKNDFKVDFRRCSIETPFQFYLYRLKEDANKVAQSLYEELTRSVYRVDGPEKACLFVLLATSNKQQDFNKLAFWSENGENNLIIFIDEPKEAIDVGDAMVVSSDFSSRIYRHHMDLALYLKVLPYSIDQWKNYPILIDEVPRPYLFSFATTAYGLTDIEKRILDRLQNFCTEFFQNKCLIEIVSEDNTWERCQLIENTQTRETINRNSTFVILFTKCPSFQQRLFEVLWSGAIPVVASLDEPLPFQDLIDWRNAIVQIPLARFFELPQILQRISLVEILKLKRRGRFYLENFLGDMRVVSRSIFSAYRYRFGMSSPARKTIPTHILLEISNFTTIDPTEKEQESSPLLQVPPLLQTYTIWNSDPTHLETDHISPLGTILYPSGSDSLIPGLKTSHLPSDSSYHNILGGSQPDENYTIIMLAYKRDEQIKIAVNRMNDLKFLDRVIVVWNDVKREPPLSDWWPILHVPLFIVNGTKNSLNNRFLPYDLIRTEAVFNMDDDFEATNEYIGLMFRVWRENRDVIVGPNFRLGYIENTGGKYGGPNKCEYNMVLTSAAFIHRSYLYAYTYLMPEAIRTKIDELINCEDIAVNFLVSHLTRKPPIKATPIRNSVGSKAAGGLSTRGSHYTKRAECIKFFTEVYGYNPLISSQFRADSLSYGFGYGQHCFKSTK